MSNSFYPLVPRYDGHATRYLIALLTIEKDTRILC